MQQISLREANQHLSQYIEAVEQGDEVIITRRGQPIARLLPIPKTRRLSRDQQVTWQRLFNQMTQGFKLGGKKFNRDAAHER